MKLRSIIAGFVAVTLMLTGCGTTIADKIGGGSGKESVQNTQTTEGTEITVDTKQDNSCSLVFAGDLCLDEHSAPILALENYKNELNQCVSKTYLRVMKDADICMANQISPFTTRTKAFVEKTYLYQADPDRVKLMHDLGIDIVSLANNNSCDYGTEGLNDTISLLDKEKIRTVGAGENAKAAYEPYYFDKHGKKYAYLAASMAEKEVTVPAATENTAGIATCYEIDSLVRAIAEAKQKADYVIVYAYWGDEYEEKFSDKQQETAHAFVDAGADLVVGSHPHVVQGMEFYKNKLIAYSLGNFWVNGKHAGTMLLEVTVSRANGVDEVDYRIWPGVTDSGRTAYQNDESLQKEFYTDMISLSKNIIIDKDGRIYQEE